MSTTDDVLVGRYRLLQQIGAGGMGVVWRAYDERLGRDVAVKRLLPGPGLSDEDAQVASHRAMREARITARLHHPHAVPVFDVVEDRGRPCLVMQYFPSTSLAELVADGRALPVSQVAGIGGQVASALAAAHDVGIVHRDVKPANVLVSPEGEAKITDFGISHALGDVSLTTSGLVTGTPAYLAPEVARGEPATPASDVFSLGSTLYTVLEGRTPFGASENPMALLHRVASARVEPPLRAGALTALVTSMLAVRPEDRPSMQEVARRLAGSGETAAPTAGEVGGSEPPEGDPLAAFRDQEPDRLAGDDALGRPAGKRAVLVVLALVAVGIAVAIGVATRPGDAPAASPQRSASVTRSSGPATATTASPSARPSARTPAPSSSVPRPTPAPTRTSTPTSEPTQADEPPAITGPPSAQQLRGALRDYYALLPGDLDAGWSRLTERYQRTTARNRAYYDSFWGSVDEVGLSDVSASPPGSVTATVTYDYTDGRRFVERTSYRLVREDGELKIDRSTVLSSRQR